MVPDSDKAIMKGVLLEEFTIYPCLLQNVVVVQWKAFLIEAHKMFELSGYSRDPVLAVDEPFKKIMFLLYQCPYMEKPG